MSPEIGSRYFDIPFKDCLNDAVIISEKHLYRYNIYERKK